MFIGHYAVAFLLAAAYPHAALAAFLGVAFPDVLFGILTLLGVERFELGRSARQDAVRFRFYPYSHSLVLTTLIAGFVALPFFYAQGFAPGLVFVAGSASHWLLDLVVHVPDLPLLGFGRDVKLGFGLWRVPPAAFLLELFLYNSAAVAFVPVPAAYWVVAIGTLAHVSTVQSVFATEDTPNTVSERAFSSMALAGFLVMSLVLFFLVG